MNYRVRQRQYQEKYKREFPRKWFLYCREPLENIEGWAVMLNDTSGQPWNLHHRDEIQGDVVVRKCELKSRGEYYNLTTSKLIFMTEYEHHSLHYSGEQNPMYGKTGEQNPASKPIEIGGVIYESRIAAAEALGKTRVTIWRWLKEGKARYI